MPKRKKKPKHKTYLKYVLIWNLIILTNVASLYAFPQARSSYSFQRILLVHFTLGTIASICLYVSLKKSFKKNIKYVYIIFILLFLSPVISILTNELFVQFDEDRRSLFKPYNFSCSMYPGGAVKKNECFSGKLYRFVAKDECKDVD
jgi:hypothetical protein